MRRVARFDKESNDNTLLLTYRCDNRCLMCCQPPVQCEDVDELFRYNSRLIAEAPTDLPEIGLTGGEPTLLGERFITLIKQIRTRMPETVIHLLSNGRAFADGEYVAKLKEAAGEKLYVGIPLHSDFEGDHDAVTCVQGSYAETVSGLYQLAACDIPVELRIVVQKMNCERLSRMADFVLRNLPFAERVPLMAMEYTGCVRRHAERVWAEPADYISHLTEAVHALSDGGMVPLLYNFPLCLLPEELRPFAVRSISDWKVRYLPVCRTCRLQKECGGLFATSQEHIFRGIAPV